MKLLFVSALFALTSSFPARAQFAAGSYVLVAEAPIRHPAMLKLQGSKALVVRAPDKSKHTLTPQEVAGFKVGRRTYTTAASFALPFTNELVGKSFVEQLDSGQVVLLRYEYTTSIYSTAGGSPNGSSYEHWLYLLYTPHNQAIVVLPPNAVGYAGNKFREAIAPFLENRLDLGAIVTIDNLPAIIHALNTDEPYDPTIISGY